MRSGLQRERRLDLIGDDLGDELAAHREVRVGEVVDLPGEDLGDAVGPAAVAAGRGRLGVADALGERVADARRSAATGAAPGLIGVGSLIVARRSSSSSSVRDRLRG